MITPFRGSAIWSPVVCRASNTSDTVAVGELCFKIAQAPATCGVAIDVPLKNPNSALGRDEKIDEPGAKRDKKDTEFEKDEIKSAFVVDPTLTAVEMHAGSLMASMNPLFPEATAVAISKERKLSIAAFLAALAASHDSWLVNRPPPRLILAEAICRLAPNPYTCSRPAI